MGNMDINKDIVKPDMARTAVGEVTACDPSLHEEIVRPWDLVNTPLERGAFGYRMRYLQTPTFTLYREQFDLFCRLQGLSPSKVFAFSIPICAGTRSHYWRKPLHESGIPAMFPGELDVEMDTGQDQLLVLVDLSLLHRHLPAELCDNLRFAASTHLLPAQKKSVGHLRNWLVALLDKMNRQPSLLQNPTTLQSIEEELLARLVDVVQVSPTHCHKKLPSRRERGFNRALEFLREADSSSVTVPELCKIAGVSTRTLEYAFREKFDLTPLSFLHLKRFHDARRKLMRATPLQTTVAEIAAEVGFFHLARFAANYRRLFDELPSQTLKQQCAHATVELSPLIG